MSETRQNDRSTDASRQLLSDNGQMIAELSAGRLYLKAPKAKRDLIDELLIKPLKELDSAAPSEGIRVIASWHLNWLLQNLKDR